MTTVEIFDGTPAMARRVGLDWHPVGPNARCFGFVDPGNPALLNVVVPGTRLIIDPQGHAVGIADKETT